VLFGYARVSTAEQNPDHQIDALLHAGVAAKDIHVDQGRREVLFGKPGLRGGGVF
jgi:DNA invertase Pin-like site-specific DNA recombinase